MKMNTHLRNLDEESHPKLFLCLRLLIAVPAFILGSVLFITGIGAGYAAVGYIPLATACFIVAGLCIAPPIAAKLGFSFASLIFPAREFDRPQPKYSIPEARRAQGQSEEAFVGFQKIAEDYPDAGRPYLEMMDIASRDLHNPELASAIFQEAMGKVKDKQARKDIRQLYDDIRTDSPHLPPDDS